MVREQSGETSHNGVGRDYRVEAACDEVSVVNVGDVVGEDVEELDEVAEDKGRLS